MNYEEFKEPAKVELDTIMRSIEEAREACVGYQKDQEDQEDQEAEGMNCRNELCLLDKIEKSVVYIINRITAWRHDEDKVLEAVDLCGLKYRALQALELVMDSDAVFADRFYSMQVSLEDLCGLIDRLDYADCCRVTRKQMIENVDLATFILLLWITNQLRHESLPNPSFGSVTVHMDSENGKVSLESTVGLGNRAMVELSSDGDRVPLLITEILSKPIVLKITNIVWSNLYVFSRIIGEGASIYDDEWLMKTVRYISRSTLLNTVCVIRDIIYTESDALPF